MKIKLFSFSDDRRQLIGDCASDVFFISLASYVLATIIEDGVPAIISYYVNISWLLYILLASGAIAVIALRHDAHRIFSVHSAWRGLLAVLVLLVGILKLRNNGSAGMIFGILFVVIFLLSYSVMHTDDQSS